jgi:hypothetical protein
MKILRLILFIAAIIALASFMGHQATAQPTNLTEDKGVLGKYEQLFQSLSKRGDTNTLAAISDLLSSIDAEKDATEITMTVRVLESLRSGHTNDAFRLLETRLDGALITFGAPSDSPRDTKYDNILKAAKAYRTKYPHSSGNPNVDTGVSKAFESLPK